MLRDIMAPAKRVGAMEVTMTRTARLLIVALVVATSVTAFAAGGLASTFVAWRIADVSADDVLMVRAQPNANAPILVGYPDGVTLSLTGRCTGGVYLDDIHALPQWQQRQIVRSEWCEIWIDPYATGNYLSAWVYGRYIAPL